VKSKFYFKKVIKILKNKYGKFVVDAMVNSSLEVLINNSNLRGEKEQSKVKDHLRGLTDVEGNYILSKSILDLDVEWGFDFSGWLGPLNQSEIKFMFIGAEPNISHNYKIAYDFGSKENYSKADVALFHYDTKWTKLTRDIWNIVGEYFTNGDDIEGEIKTLSSCYITDLCHFVPKGCSNVKQICQKLKIKSTDWNKIRSRVAKKYLLDEINELSPDAIILHGNASRLFFQKEFAIENLKVENIEDSNYTIFSGLLGKYKILGIPHLSGDVRNKLWRCKSFPSRGLSAKSILCNILYSESTDKKNIPSNISDIETDKNPHLKKYVDLKTLVNHLEEIGISKIKADISIIMIKELNRDYSIKPTRSGFTLYAPKISGKGRRLFANFILDNSSNFEVRFLYHGYVNHPKVKVLPETKKGKLVYLLNHLVSELPFNCDDSIVKLMHDSFDVIHEGRHNDIKKDYVKKRNL
jgi:hypothetical protein